MMETTLQACAAPAELFGAGLVTANDAVGSVAAGGVVLHSEPHIAMKKERLFISLNRVRVDYEFVNESAADIKSDILFPIAEFPAGGPGEFVGGFAVSVDGRRVRVGQDVRAFFEGRDVSQFLRQAGLDLVAWVDDDWMGRDAMIRRLPTHRLATLRDRGLLSHFQLDRPVDGHMETDEPQWTLRITYYWKQRFPAGRVVHVAHEYHPAVGASVGISASALAAAGADERVKEALNTAVGSTHWVDYVLTTANTWKTPIGEFELIVERPAKAVVSFRWDGPIERIGPNTLRATVKDFVPKRELSVYYFEP